MNAREYLDAVQTRADEATEGPWEVDAVEPTVFTADFDMFGGTIADINYDQLTGGHAPKEDAEFIAAARSDVPHLVAALRAVLGLHQPREVVKGASTAWMLGASEECNHCHREWPCPTVRAIEDALGDES